MLERQQRLLVQQIQTTIMNNTSLINRTRTKRKCLDVANDTHQPAETPSVRRAADGTMWDMTRARQARNGRKYTQVSQELLDELDTEFRRMVYERVTSRVQTGKTVK